MDSLITLGAFIIANAPNLVGFLIPPVVEVLNKDVHGANERFLVTVFTCLLAATILHWGELLYGSPEQLLTSAGIIFTESQVVFKLYFQNSWVRWKIQTKIGGEGDKIEKPIG